MIIRTGQYLEINIKHSYHSKQLHWARNAIQRATGKDKEEYIHNFE